MTANELIRAKILTDTLFATRYLFKQRFGRSFIVGEHHKLIAQHLDKVLTGEIKRLMILMPPRYAKTEMAVKTFIAQGLAINPASKFIHTSYSKDLALDNASEVKEILQSDYFQELFPHIKIARGEAVKHKWYTEQGGGVYTTSTAGQITGFGAGEVENETEINETIEELEKQTTFAGAIIIDDPIKPEDASSATMREKVNMRFETTIRSRTNSRNTPIILIMQRLHKNDLAGYLMSIEPDDWTVLSLPALSVNEDGEEVALWEFKHTVAELKKIQSANRFVFETQYQQNPKEINEKLWCFAFNSEKHVGTALFNPNEYLYLSFDFNRNPLCVTLWQNYNDTIFCVDTIQMEDATVQTVCAEIDRRYHGAFFLVTGDASGKSKTTVSILDNFQIIKNYFDLTKGQMQYSGSNPRLQDSRYFVNAIFEKANIVIDKDKCKPLIFDLENVLSDSENKPIKTSRTNVAEQADCFDTMRYFLHRFCKDVLK